jgi:DNA-directed RNA polymerase specialized sigma24 family protein
MEEYCFLQSGKGRLFTWIMNIARNGAIDAARAEGRKPAMDDIENRAVLNERDVYEDSQTVSSEMKAIVNMLRPERKDPHRYGLFSGLYT